MANIIINIVRIVGIYKVSDQKIVYEHGRTWYAQYNQKMNSLISVRFKFC